MKSVILMPTYNERENIQLMVPEVFAAHPELHMLVVDDNSPDGTSDAVRELMRTYPNLELLHRPGKEGLGKAYQDAMLGTLEDPSVERIITMDADGSHAVEYLTPMLAASRDNDLVIGSRYVAGGGGTEWNTWRYALSRGGNIYARILTGLSLHDLTAGFMCFHADTLRKIELGRVSASGYAFLVELKFYARYAAHARIKEIPIRLRSRREGESKLAGHIIREGIRTPWRLLGKRISFFLNGERASFSSLSITERFMLLGLAIGSFVGIWHALPLVHVVDDEMYYVGGVLRAIEAHSLIPLPGDVPYGTLTFYLNYLLALPFLLTLLVAKGFSFSAAKMTLVLHPEYAYIVPRILSALLASLFIWYYDRFLRKEGISPLQRFTVLSVPLMTLLPAVVFHTGKMWVLSMLFVFASMLFLYRALADKGTLVARKAGFWSILMGFIAFANFPLAALFLVNVPILLYAYRSDTAALRTFLRGMLYGVGILLLVFLVNFKSIIAQVTDIFTNYHPILQNVAAHTPLHLSVISSFLLHGQQLLVTFPLTLLLIVVLALLGTVRSRMLLSVSLAYALIYFIFLVGFVTWSGSLDVYLRYLFPFGFFLSGMVAAFDARKMRSAVWTFCGTQLLVYLYLLFLLSVPTSFNLARDYVTGIFSGEHALILNAVPQLDLPMNSETAALTEEKYCGTKCAYLRENPGISAFGSVVVNAQSNARNLNPAAFARILWIGEENPSPDCSASSLQSFDTGAPSSILIDTEQALGDYLLPSFWHLGRLGEGVGLYQVSGPCVSRLIGSLQP